jgi:hypothetical protein
VPKLRGLLENSTKVEASARSSSSMSANPSLLVVAMPLCLSCSFWGAAFTLSAYRCGGIGRGATESCHMQCMAVGPCAYILLLDTASGTYTQQMRLESDAYHCNRVISSVRLMRVDACGDGRRVARSVRLHRHKVIHAFIHSRRHSVEGAADTSARHVVVAMFSGWVLCRCRPKAGKSGESTAPAGLNQCTCN